VRFERLNAQLRLSVDDDGVGFMHSPQNDAPIGQGQELVRGFARELGGDLEIEPTTSGSSCRVTFPYATPRSI
jgi:two-component sensor histidine kinase